jgi:hypothetical protein
MLWMAARARIPSATRFQRGGDTDLGTATGGDATGDSFTNVEQFVGSRLGDTMVGGTGADTRRSATTRCAVARATIRWRAARQYFIEWRCADTHPAPAPIRRLQHVCQRGNDPHGGAAWQAMCCPASGGDRLGL